MKEQLTGECPLCINSAGYKLIDGENCRIYECPTCRDFEIGSIAECKVRNMTIIRREALSVLARDAPEGFLLNISYDAGRESEPIALEYVSRR